MIPAEALPWMSRLVALLERLGAKKGLKGALVSIDAIATNAEVARAITSHGADYLLAVKAKKSVAPPCSAKPTGSPALVASRASSPCPAPPA